MFTVLSTIGSESPGSSDFLLSIILPKHPLSFFGRNEVAECHKYVFYDNNQDKMNKPTLNLSNQHEFKAYTKIG
ncbi:hypothetical protein Palpr_0996 [Paludibacter propionicigenes WB4]|uniref:Uncharacterized protein n=1 Tax=Paludibacter propionicigenes (strain DSM 17365 / JCM 13257 / WB4) TaxID=694427 RepID=E4T352_PALPW|nr:hypothetical protein Palpr_0996 [Paludibacter propionicigenes WB4]